MLDLLHTLDLEIQVFNHLVQKKAFENKVGKRENLDIQHVFLFPQCVSSFLKQILDFLPKFILSTANSFNLYMFKILSFGKD